MLGPIDDFRFYRDLGLSVIPCEFMGKRPKIEWMEFQKRIATIEEIEQWCRIRCNVAIVTGQVSRLAFVDIDTDAAFRWAKENLPEPPCKTITSRGEQWAFSLLKGLIVGNRAKIRGLGLDLRVEGGYVLGASSTHPDGTIYERLGDWSKIHDSPVFDPSWLETAPKAEPRKRVEAFTPIQSEKLRRAHAYAAKVPGAVSGEGGHRATFSLACKLVRNFDLSEDELFSVLSAWNRTCSPEWKDSELQHKSREALKAVKGPVVQITQETRRDAVLTFKNPKTEKCAICRKTKPGGEVEFVDKRFPGPVFLCFRDIEKQTQPETEKKS